MGLRELQADDHGSSAEAALLVLLCACGEAPEVLQPAALVVALVALAEVAKFRIVVCGEGWVGLRFGLWLGMGMRHGGGGIWFKLGFGLRLVWVRSGGGFGGYAHAEEWEWEWELE